MLSNTKAKFIKSLQIKKYRKKHRSFLVEGAKNVQELLDSEYDIDCLVVSEEFRKNNLPMLSNARAEIYIEKQDKINSLGTLKTNNSGLAVVKVPEEKTLTVERELFLVLDDVRDPGNLGTIIRTADWFGVRKIVASEETAEFYNPKVIQASMGSFTRVDVYYRDLPLFFEQFGCLEVLGAYTDGTPVHDVPFTLPAAVLLGNESNGISGEMDKFVTAKITIPRIGKAESLNVAMSAAIICDNLMRRIKEQKLLSPD